MRAMKMNLFEMKSRKGSQDGWRNVASTQATGGARKGHYYTLKLI